MKCVIVIIDADAIPKPWGTGMNHTAWPNSCTTACRWTAHSLVIYS